MSRIGFSIDLLSRVGCCLAALLMLQPVYGEDANHEAMIFNTADACEQALSDSSHENINATSLIDELKVVNWNIKKGSMDGWDGDLLEVSSDAQLVFLQEATRNDGMQDLFHRKGRDKRFWSFAPGFHTSSFRSGLMTLSNLEPAFLCNISVQEPWLRSPKVTSISYIPLPAMQSALLLVNIHQINFTLGVSAFSKQLEEIADIIDQFDGPVIFTGDFNTWSKTRHGILDDLATDLGMQSVDFTADYRKKVFGQHLDYIFVRGFEIKNSETIPLQSSDHNPLMVTLKLYGDDDA